MNYTMYPKKVFKIGPLQNCVLDNIEENTAFASLRLTKLKSQQIGSSGFYAVLKDLFTEFIDIYEYDKITAIMPEPFGLFNSPEEKQLWKDNRLLALEFDLHLGFILYNYHEWLFDNGQIPDIVLSRMIIDYPSVYQKVLYDYVSVLKRFPSHYPFKIGFQSNNENARVIRSKLVSSLQ